MITYIKGQLEEIEPEQIVIDNGGIGYRIMVPASMVQRLPSIGETVKIHTYMHVREDDLKLFGFLSKEDLTMFKMLIKVSGIGPKGALGILSVMTSDELRFAILADDAKAIAKAPGIGAKTAGKLILELKDKCDWQEMIQQSLSVTQKQEEKTGVSMAGKEAVEALVALGYSSTEAAQAVRKVEITPDMQVEEVLKLSLKNM